MNNIGANIDTIPGAIKSIEWHKTNNTKTHNNLVNLLSKFSIGKIKDELAICHLPSNVFEQLEKLGMDNGYYSTTVDDTITDPVVSLCDIFALRLVGSSGMSKTHLIGHTIYSAYLTELENTTCELVNDDMSKLRASLDLPLYQSILKRHMSRIAGNTEIYEKLHKELNKEGKWFKSLPPNKETIMITTPTVMCWGRDRIKKEFESWKKIYFWCPFEIRTIKDRTFAVLKNSAHTWEINKGMHSAMVSGIYIPGTNLKIHLVKSMGVVGLFEINDHHLWIESQKISDKLVIVPTPLFMIDPIAAITTGNLLETRNIAHNYYLLDNLRRRALRPNTTWDDLLVQLRTLINTAQFSTHAVSSKYKTDVGQGKDSARLAWAMKIAMDKKYQFLTYNDDPIRAVESGLLFATEIMQPAFSNLWQNISELLGAGEYFTKDNIDIVKRFINTTANFLNSLSLQIADPNPRWMRGNQQKGFGIVNMPSASNRLLIETHELKKWLSYTNDCPICCSQIVQLLYNGLGYPVKANDSTINSVGNLRTDRCPHRARGDITLNVWTKAKSGLNVVGARSIDEGDIPFQVGMAGVTVSENKDLSYPRDNTWFANNGKQTRFTACIIKVTAWDPFIESALELMEDCTILIHDPSMKGKLIGLNNALKNEVYYYDQEGSGNPTLSNVGIPSESKSASIMWREQMAEKGLVAVVKPESQLRYDSTLNEEQAMAVLSQNSGGMERWREISDRVLLNPRPGFKSIRVIRCNHRMVDLTKQCPGYIAMKFNGGKAAISSWFNVHYDNDYYLTKAPTDKWVIGIQPSLGGSNSVAIDWDYTTASEDLGKIIENFDYKGYAYKEDWDLWTNSVLSGGVEMIKCYSDLELGKLIASATQLPYNTVLTRNACGHEQIRMFPLSIISACYCSECGAALGKTRKTEDGNITNDMSGLDVISRPKENIPTGLRFKFKPSTTQTEYDVGETQIVLEYKGHKVVYGSHKNRKNSGYTKVVGLEYETIPTDMTLSQTERSDIIEDQLEAVLSRISENQANDTISVERAIKEVTGTKGGLQDVESTPLPNDKLAGIFDEGSQQANLVIDLDSINHTLEGRRIPIYKNMLIHPFEPRLGPGRNLLHLDTMHLVDKEYMSPGPITMYEMKFLRQLQYKILQLKPLPTDIWNIYAMDGKEIIRGPSPVPGRHLAIVSDTNLTSDYGFEIIQVSRNLFRLFASIRPIICYLLPYFDTVYLRGGRPGLHVMFGEAYQAMNHENFRNNAAVVCTNNFGPIIDGLVFKTKPSLRHMAEYISSNLKYYEIYGIDECNPEWFEIKECHHLPRSPHGYSNSAISSKYKEWVDGMKMVDMEQHFDMVRPYSMEWVVESFRCNKTTIELAGFLDPNLNITTRVKNLETLPSIREWIEEQRNKSKIGQIPTYVLDTPYMKDPVGTIQVSNLIENFRVETIYNPDGSKFCGWKCFHWCLDNRTDDGLKYNHRILKGMIGPKRFATIKEILSWWQMTELNYEIITQNQVYSGKFNNGPVDRMDVVVNRDGTQHLRVIRIIERGLVEEVKPLRQSSVVTVETTNIKRESLLLDAVKTGNTSLLTEREKNAHMRVGGNWVHVISHTNGIESDLNPIACPSDAGMGFKVSNLTTNKAYLIGTDTGMQLMVAHELKDSNYAFLLTNSKWISYAIDIGCNLDRNVKRKRTLIDAKIGHLNLESKRYAQRIGHPSGGVPVDIMADKIYVFHTDGNDHHGREEHKKLINTHNSNIVLEDTFMEAMDADTINTLKDTLKFSGPIRLGIIEGNLELVTAAAREADNIKLISIADAMMRRKTEDKFTIVEKWSRVDWEQAGNRLIPTQIRKLVEKLYDLKKEFKTKHQIDHDLCTSYIKLNGKDLRGVLHAAYPTLLELGSDIDLDADYKLMGETFQGITADIAYSDSAIHDPGEFMSYSYSKYGYGYEEESKELLYIHQLKHQGIATHQYWAQANEEKQLDLSGEQTSLLKTINCLNDWDTIQDPTISDGASFHVTESQLIVGSPSPSQPTNLEPIAELPDAITVNYWEDETAMIPGVVKVPPNSMKLVSRTEFLGLKEQVKGVTTQFPIRAQPNYTKRMNAGAQAASDLFGAKLSLREFEHDPQFDAKQFCQTYFNQNSLKHLEKIEINYETTLSWLRTRPDGIKIVGEIDSILSEGLDIIGMDKVNVHMKLESRMKDIIIKSLMTNHEAGTGMPENIEEQRVRLIVWQRKGITALFAPCFSQVKEHLKRCLRGDVIYADGYTPMQLSAKLNQFKGGPCTFVEDDLKKQDRQTDQTLIDTEMAIYHHLGLSPNVINMWRVVHTKWRAKGMGIKFMGDASRHTGQATTAIGNVIVNLLVHGRFIRSLGKSLIVMLVLGDDNLMICRQEVSKEKVSENSARHFNMVSAPVINKKFGCFLRMLVYTNRNGQLEMGPDIVRLKYRFEVLNGSGITTQENITARSMSYLCMIGSNRATEKLVKSKKWPIKLERWYDWHSLMYATGLSYSCTEEYCEAMFGTLLEYISRDSVKIVTKLMFTERGN
jgi:hypothetical protein